MTKPITCMEKALVTASIRPYCGLGRDGDGGNCSEVERAGLGDGYHSSTNEVFATEKNLSESEKCE